MTEMQMSDIMSHLKEMQQEHAQLKAVSANYKEYADTLKDVAQKLLEVAKQLDPYVAARESRPEFDYASVVNDIYDKIKSGTQIDSRFIVSTYHTATNQTMYILSKLKQMPGIKVRKEGMRAFLYI